MSSDLPVEFLQTKDARGIIKERLIRSIKDSHSLRAAVAYFNLNHTELDGLGELLSQPDSFICVDIGLPTELLQLKRLDELCKNVHLFHHSDGFFGCLHAKLLLFTLKEENIAEIWIGSQNFTLAAINGPNYHWIIEPKTCSDEEKSDRIECVLSEPAKPAPGIYKIQLQITDINGFKAISEEKTVFVGSPLAVGDLKVLAVDAKGDSVNVTDGWFRSGITDGNGTFISPSTVSVKLKEKVTITTTIGVPQNYQTKQGKILIVLGSNGNFQAVNANKCTGALPYEYPEIKLDGTDSTWVDTLVGNCYQEIKQLPSVQEVIYQETFGVTGIFDIYIGIESGRNIFYSPAPLKVKVVN